METNQELDLLNSKIKYLEESLALHTDLSKAIWHVKYHSKELQHKEGMIEPSVRYHESQLLKYTEIVATLRKKIDIINQPAPSDLVVDNEVS